MPEPNGKNDNKRTKITPETKNEKSQKMSNKNIPEN